MANSFWPIGDRVYNGVPLYCNQSNGSFNVRREHVFLFVCLFFQSLILLHKRSSGISLVFDIYKAHVILFVAQKASFAE